MTEVVVKELSPSLRDDFLLFFDHVAFADNPDWSDCYCSAYHFANNKGKAESRHQASLLIEDDRMTGSLPMIMESLLAGVMLLLVDSILPCTGCWGLVPIRENVSVQSSVSLWRLLIATRESRRTY